MSKNFTEFFFALFEKIYFREIAAKLIRKLQAA